ncbi:DoxX family protein [Deinococcus sp.]|uniref:DoxX family protein n=1 Tax=Deinococcus sp. TaxID=47478 RepID=UPI0028698452|nr:DoxX family protein [Deinococcus sp.]
MHQGAAGPILPWLTSIWPWLTPLAALGFAVIMVLAYRVHERLMHRAPTPRIARRDSLNRVTNVVLLLASLAVVIVCSQEPLST